MTITSIDLHVPMAGFDLQFWSDLGFKLFTTLDYENKKEVHARSTQGDIKFTLLIFERSDGAIGGIDLPNGHHEHHAISQREAIGWFCSKSPELKEKVERTPYSDCLAWP